MSELSQLHEAIKGGDEKTAMKLIERGTDANTIYSRETAFTEAIESNRDAIALKIMKHPSFKPNAANRFDRSPLFIAAKEGKFEMAVALLALGAEVDTKDLRGVTPLGATAWYDKHEVAQLLIDHGADLNQQDDSGESPLFRACSNVSINVVKVLLKNGANVELKTSLTNSGQQMTPLMAAIPSNYELEVRGRKMTEMIELLKLMLSTESDINATQKRGMNALHIAVDRHQVFASCVLADAGCDLDQMDDHNMTPFHLAIRPERPMYEIALYLLTFGANANLRLLDEKSGKMILPLTMVMKTRPEEKLVQKQRTRLLYALIPATDLSGRGLFEVIETMLEEIPVPAGDVTILEEFHVVKQPMLQHHCRLLIRKILGQNIMKKIDKLPISKNLKKYLSMEFDFKEFHPLDACGVHTAVVDNEANTLRKYLDSGCSVNIPLGENIPLTLAAHSGNIDIVKILLAYGADPSALDRGGQSALHKAASQGHNGVIKLLLNTSCDVNSLDIDGNTPLQKAADNGQFETVIYLIKNGAKSSIVGKKSVPSLHLAAGSGHLRATKVIIDDTDNINCTDALGNTALHVAASKGTVYLKNNIRLPALYKNDVFELLDAVKMPLTSESPQYVRKDGVLHKEVVNLLIRSGTDKTILNVDKIRAVEYAAIYFREALDLFNPNALLHT